MRTVTPHRLALALITVLHVVATITFLPPAAVIREAPLETVDYPVHTHRVHVYREGLRESGFPWGYDPAVSAGTVMNPGQDAGAKALQVFSLAVPFVSPAVSVKLFVFLTLLIFPLFVLHACKLIGVSADARLWAMLVLIIPAWVDFRIIGFVRWGLIGFVAASYISVLVLGLFLRYVREPSGGGYVLFSLAAALLMLLHVLGPVVILPVLVAFTLMAEGLSLRQRLALMAVPVIVVLLNSFWLYPLLLAQHIPQPPGFDPLYPRDSVAHLQVGDLSELFLNAASVVGFAGAVALFVYGLIVLKRDSGSRTAVAVGATGVTGLLLTLFGSAVPIVSIMQPVRFFLPTFALMSIPVGAGLAALVAAVRLDPAWTAVATSAGALVAGLALGYPEPLDVDKQHAPLQEFIEANTRPGDRLLIQAEDGYNYRDYESKVYPMILHREVIGSNFPQPYDPPQFLGTMLLGKELSAWQTDRLGDALQRWGADWVFTITDEADSLIAATLKIRPTAVGEYLAFPIKPAPSRFAAGNGSIAAGINRIELSNLKAEDGVVVLRYRYHPAWEATTSVIVYRHPVEEDASGFLALKNPPESLVLKFRPWVMLRAPWPSWTVDRSGTATAVGNL